VAPVVCGDQHGHAVGVEALQQVHDLVGELRIEISGRFVGEQDRGTVYHGARDTHTLPLAGGEFDGMAFLLGKQSHLIEGRAHATPGLQMTHAAYHQRQRHVVEHGALGEQLMVLEDHADLAAEKGNAPARQARQVALVDNDLTARRAFREQQQADQRAFPRAGMANQEGHLALVQRKAHAPECIEAAHIAFVYLADANHGRESGDGRRASVIGFFQTWGLMPGVWRLSTEFRVRRKKSLIAGSGLW
jgi:hypothetical protein